MDLMTFSGKEISDARPADPILAMAGIIFNIIQNNTKFGYILPWQRSQSAFKLA